MQFFKGRHSIIRGMSVGVARTISRTRHIFAGRASIDLRTWLQTANIYFGIGRMRHRGNAFSMHNPAFLISFRNIPCYYFLQEYFIPSFRLKILLKSLQWKCVYKKNLFIAWQSLSFFMICWRVRHFLLPRKVFFTSKQLVIKEWSCKVESSSDYI